MFNQSDQGKRWKILGVMFFLTVYGCSANPQATAGGSAWKAAEKDLLLRRNHTNNTVVQLKGELLPRTRVAQQSVEQIARMVLRTYREKLLIRNPDAEFSTVSVTKDSMGYTRIRFAQQYRGVPVWKATLSIHLDPQQQPYLLSGAYFPTPEGIDIDSGKNEHNALQAASRFDPKVTAANYVIHKIIFFQDDRLPLLAYELKPEGRAVFDGSIYIVDAETGKMLARLPVMQPLRKPR